MLDRVSNRAVFERYLTAAEERQLFGYVDQFGGPLAARDAAWMRLMRHTGLRVASVAGLTVADAKAALSTGHLVARDECARASAATRSAATSPRARR